MEWAESRVRSMSMINQKHCPVCHQAAARGCKHLALAAEGRDFVRRCIELCQGRSQWLTLLDQRRHWRRRRGEWPPEPEDFTWLETAFCAEFLERLRWFAGLDHEWRTGPKPGEGGFWVLLWSKDPQRLWWDLRDEFERQIRDLELPKPASPPGNGAVNPGATFARL
jgi:hypothetical protein